MKVYNDHGNPVIVFEQYPFSWFHQRYFLSIELYYTGTEDFLKKIVVTGRASVPEYLMRQDDSLISEEFRKIIEYLEKHPDLCQVLQEISTPEGSREEYSLEDLRAFNQVSGPIHLGAAPMKGRSMRDILTLEWNAEKGELSADKLTVIIKKEQAVMNPENLQDELPEVIKLGPRIGKLATHPSDGFTAPIEAIRRFKDGYEIITITDPVTGRGVADNPENFSIHF